jgi:hypothetical protein
MMQQRHLHLLKHKTIAGVTAGHCRSPLPTKNTIKHMALAVSTRTHV